MTERIDDYDNKLYDKMNEWKGMDSSRTVEN